MKQKFTNLYGAIRDAPSVCKASSAVCMVREKICVETYGIEITSSGTSPVQFFDTYEFSETIEKIDTKI